MHNTIFSILTCCKSYHNAKRYNSLQSLLKTKIRQDPAKRSGTYHCLPNKLGDSFLMGPSLSGLRALDSTGHNMFAYLDMARDMAAPGCSWLLLGCSWVAPGCS